MKNFTRELKDVELEKYVGGIDIKNETHQHDGGGAGPNCRDLLIRCTGGQYGYCQLFDQFC